MAAAPGCDCAIVSGQSSPNNHPRRLLCATFRLLMRIQSAFAQTGIRFLDDDRGSSIGVRINAPHPIPPKVANVSVLQSIPIIGKMPQRCEHTSMSSLGDSVKAKAAV